MSEALIFESTNPQYDDRFFVVHENCKLRIPAEHVVYTNGVVLVSPSFATFKLIVYTVSEKKWGVHDK